MNVIFRFARYLFIGAYPNGAIGGLVLTLILSIVSGVFSFCVGLIVGLMRISKTRVIRGIATAYVEIVRGIPFVIVLFWFYLLLPRLLGRSITEVRSSLGALVFFFGAYAAEVVRAGILSVSKGQIEAAESTGLSYWQTLFYVVFPQALGHMLPSLANLYVSLVKDTSLIYFIGVVELTGAATQVMRRESYAIIQLFAFILLVYWVLCTLLNAVSDKLEKRAAA